MNKLAVSLFLIATTLLTTACSNKSDTIKIPISIISKDITDTKYLEIKEDSSLQDKIELIVDTISKLYFNGLPMKVRVWGENIAKVELIEFQDDTKNRVSWKEDYLNEYTKEYTINTIVKNILQEEYEGNWIEKVQLYYKGELIELN